MIKYVFTKVLQSKYTTLYMQVLL